MAEGTLHAGVLTCGFIIGQQLGKGVVNRYYANLRIESSR
jgi:lipid-binding SYLF domain-containing protein